MTQIRPGARRHDPPTASKTADPYFFLSYAHAPSIRGQDDPDYLIEQVLTDLSTHIMHMTDHPDGPVGIIDRHIPAGKAWKADILGALARCRVLLAFYSDRYFSSEWCGMEWHAFSVREDLHANLTGNPVHAIVPVFWTPVDQEDLPEVAQSRQFSFANMGDHYKSGGLYGLAARRRYRDDYDVATFEIAQNIVLTAKSTRLRPCGTQDFPDLRNVFDESE
ncbi:TIR-like protein FxsC [Acrocarpospora catenulata]|uniref:TIR-like protein FxsC n=1 Tax=Acrocarpospora catenulata TaxID=2836182 RepID=UPI001BDAA72A|nr:TIR-like protein FxsC [Acrocarpospora catenulata]